MSASDTIAVPYPQQRDHVVALCDELERLARLRARPALADGIGEAARRLQEGRLVIAAIGAFCSGKSTALNALLDEVDLCPVDTTIATGVVTTVSYADVEQATVRLEGEAAARRIVRSEIADYVTEERNPGNRLGVSVVSVELPNPKLRDGLIVVDTPGISGVDRSHTAVTYAFLAKADVALFVLDGQAPMTTDDLELLRVARRQCQALVVAVTKTDRLADPGVVLANTRAKVDAVCDDGGTPVPIVPISGWAKVEYLRGGDPEDLAASNFPELERELWAAFQQRRAAMLLLRPLGVLTAGVDELLAPLERELAVYGEASEAELARQDAELETGKQRLEQLRAGGAPWRRRLQRSIQDLRMEMDHHAARGSASVHARFQAALADTHKLEAPAEITGAVESDLTLLGSELSRRLEAGLAKVALEVEAAGGFDLNPVAPATAIAAQASVPALADVAFDDILGIGLLRGTSGVLTAAAALALPPPFNVVVAGAAVFGAVQLGRAQVRDHKQRTASERKAHILKHVEPPLRDALSEISHQVRIAVTEAERRRADEFDDKLAAEQRRLVESADALTAARRRTAEEARVRAAELREPVSALRRLRQAATRAAEAAVDAAEAMVGGLLAPDPAPEHKAPRPARMVPAPQEPPSGQPWVTEPATAERAPVEPRDEPAVAEPWAIEEPAALEPVPDEPVPDEPAVAEPWAIEEPAALEPVPDEPVPDEPPAAEPVLDRGAWADVAPRTAPVPRPTGSLDRGEWAEV